MSSCKPTSVAEVFRAGFDEYRTTAGAIPQHHYKVVNAIMNCRTANLGGHIYECKECSHRVTVFNSCGDRHCPTCQAQARARWVDKRMSEVVPVPYFHVVFTIPKELRPLALRNKASFYKLFFKAVSETLLTLGADPKYLGGVIGIISVLHTWTQTMIDHPHLHCLIPSGALGEDGLEWILGKKDFLFPIDVVKQLYRGKMLSMVREAVKKGDIQFHGELAPEESGFNQLIDKLYSTQWVVYIKEPFASPEAVIKYLSAYVNRVAISNTRIKNITAKTVTFSWSDRSDGNKEKLMTLTHQEFIRRFLLHVLPKGLVRIRYFGFLSNRDRKKNVAICLMTFNACDVESGPFSGDETECKDKGEAVEWMPRCPCCGKRALVRVEEIPKRFLPDEAIAA